MKFIKTLKIAYALPMLALLTIVANDLHASKKDSFYAGSLTISTESKYPDEQEILSNMSKFIDEDPCLSIKTSAQMALAPDRIPSLRNLTLGTIRHHYQNPAIKNRLFILPRELQTPVADLISRYSTIQGLALSFLKKRCDTIQMGDQLSNFGSTDLYIKANLKCANNTNNQIINHSITADTLAQAFTTIIDGIPHEPDDQFHFEKSTDNPIDRENLKNGLIKSLQTAGFQPIEIKFILNTAEPEKSKSCCLLS